LEARATRQEWFELQQAQLAYQPKFVGPKIVYPDISDDQKFAVDSSDAFIDCTMFFIKTIDEVLPPLLNCAPALFFWKGLTPELRGGFVRFKSQFVSRLPIPDMPSDARARLAAFGEACSKAARRRFEIESAVRRRILDLAPPERAKLTGKLEHWHDLDFAAVRAEVKRAFHADVPVKERGEWEAYLADNAAKVRSLSDQIAAAEREIDAIVYRLFDLTADEIALLEASLEGQY